MSTSIGHRFDVHSSCIPSRCLSCDATLTGNLLGFRSPADKVIGLAGQGTFGTVLDVLDTKHNDRVALKVVRSVKVSPRVSLVLFRQQTSACSVSCLRVRSSFFLPPSSLVCPFLISCFFVCRIAALLGGSQRRNRDPRQVEGGRQGKEIVSFQRDCAHQHKPLSFVFFFRCPHCSSSTSPQLCYSLIAFPPLD